MPKTLFIVESPNKCSKLQKILGKDYIVKASVGHIREIPRKGLNIDINNNFEPTYQFIKGKEKIFQELQKIGKDSDSILLATDGDREGEAIAYHIYDCFTVANKKKCKRVVFHEITSKAVLKSIDNQKDIDMDQVNAQKARVILDRLIGYKISPLLCRNVQNKTSAGRVQSIALKYVSEKEKEIKAFIPTDFWSIDAKFQTKEKNIFSAKLITGDKDNRITVQQNAIDIEEELKSDQYKVYKIKKESKLEHPYPPFDTASLQKTASAYWGWSTKKTSQVAQDLYTQGFLTYIRTDSYSIAPEALEEVRQYIASLGGKLLPDSPKIYSKQSDSTQDAHECIRPTDISVLNTLQSQDADRLYSLIRDRFLTCQMNSAIVENVTYNIKTKKKYEFVAKGKRIIEQNWLKYYSYKKSQDIILPVVEEKELLELHELNNVKSSTQPPPRYKEGSLVDKLEKEGVGRPSTYSSIIQTILERDYVEKIKGSKGSLGATDLGIKVCDFLNSHFDDFFMDTHFTTSLEKRLDLIATGKDDYLKVVGEVYQFMMKKLNSNKFEKTSSTEETGKKCISCSEGNIVKKNGKYGDFYCCSNYPKCKTIFELIENKFIIKEKKKVETNGESCPKCKKGILVKRINKKDKSEFYACNGYPKCKYIKS